MAAADVDAAAAAEAATPSDVAEAAPGETWLGRCRLAMAPLPSAKQSSPEAMGSPSLSWRRVWRLTRVAALPTDSLTA